MNPTARATVSVAVTTHGRPTYLASCLESIQAQTRQPDLVVVSQDGEDPETDALIAEAAHGLPLRHLRNVPPLGERRNRRQALAETRGDFVAMLDGDDQWESQFLEATSAELASRPECGFCAADHWVMDESGTVLEAETELCSRRFGRHAMRSGVYSDILLRHLESLSFSLNATLFRRDVLASIGFVPGSDAGTAPDLSIFLTLGARRVRACYLDMRLGRYRIHSEQTTRNRILMASSALSVLEQIGGQHKLEGKERDLLARRHRAEALELAIAYGHARERRAALNTLLRIRRFGFGTLSPRRVAVLSALLVGARPVRRRMPNAGT